MASKQKMLTIRMSEELYNEVKRKCSKELSIPMASLVKIFLNSFVSQKGIGFFVGDHDMAQLINRWIHKKKFEKYRGGRVAVIGPKLKDIFELGLEEKSL